MVLNPANDNAHAGASQIKHLDDLASEFGSEAAAIRANEGEAASHGVYFDDTEYDYMQHMRDLGSGAGEVVFIESEATANKGKGKQKQSLEDALKELDLEHGSQSGSQIDEELLPSKNLTRLTYESQQQVPDSIAGLQPDMDPRLREVLEALEDDAYVEDDDEIFKELAKDGNELDDIEFDETWDEDDGWESDDTAKPNKEYKDDVPDLVPVQGQQPDVGPSEDWLEDFKKFKQDEKSGRSGAAPSHSEMQSNWTMTTNGGKRKKRKGAMTNPSSYSMTSSALSRTDQLSLLDARFDVIEEKYNEDMSEMGSVSALSTASSVTGPTRGDFDGIMDDFLGNYTKPGKRTNKKNRQQTGLQQLDEIRQGLGPARFRSLGTKTT
ncbi:Low temperature viability protein [Sarocladium strictum]|jgi:protein LTV1